MSLWGFRPYVTVAERRAKALKTIEKLKKKAGRIDALVSGSALYEVRIDIDVAAPSRWKAICADCAGSVGSIVELLQGKLSKHVMERVCREADGLFPAPKELRMTCSCPDWAGMCKHVAATLYSVGARLDHEPDVLFALRGVKREDLVSVGADLSIADAGAQSERVLLDDDVAALFGLELEEASKRIPGSAAIEKAGADARKRKAALSEPAASRRRALQATDGPPPDPGGKAARTIARAVAPPTTGDGSRSKRKLSAAPTPAESTSEAAITPKTINGKAPSPAWEPFAPRGGARASRSDTNAVSGSSGGAREKSTARPQRSETSPEGRTRAAKWIDAKARKSARAKDLA